MTSMTPLWNHLAPMYQYYDGGWAFEDGACLWGHANNEDEWCSCPRPWSDAWMLLCGALGDWGHPITLSVLFGD